MIKDLYLLLLKRKYGIKILRVDDMPQDWVGIVFDDCSVHAIPPFIDKSGNRRPLKSEKSSQANIERLEAIFNSGREK